MSRVQSTKPEVRTAETQSDFDKLMKGSCAYRPLGERSDIKLSPEIVIKFLCRPTRSGKWPDEQDVMKFIMLCRARELNPFEGDAYLVGYDGQDGPQFSLITAIQAMYKRAEANADYDGIESGVIVRDSAGNIVERAGDFCHPGDALLGGWSRVHRKNLAHPFVERLNLESRNKGRSVWKNDPGGMIAKCAEAGALRRAFPGQLAGMYLPGEIADHDDKATDRPRRETATMNVDAILGAVSDTATPPGGSAATAPQPKTAAQREAEREESGPPAESAPEAAQEQNQTFVPEPEPSAPTGEDLRRQFIDAWASKLRELKGIDPEPDLVYEQVDAYARGLKKKDFSDLPDKWFPDLLDRLASGLVPAARFDHGINQAPASVASEPDEPTLPKKKR